MKRQLTVMILIAGLSLAVGCGQHTEQPTEDPARAAYTEFRDAYLDAETKAEQVALVEKFVTEHPTNLYAGYYVVDIINHYDDLGEPETAYQIVQPVLVAADDPEARFNIGMALAPVAADLGKPLDLEPLIADFEAVGPLGFYDSLSVMDAAAKTGAWQLEERHADDILSRATPEAYRADYPDREFSDEEVAERVAHRKVYALTHKGWAAFNLGRTDEALVHFAEADGLTDTNYVGLTGTPLATYWGSALLQQGDTSGAIAMLAPEAVFGDAKNAEPLLRRAFTAFNGNSDGFEEFLDTTRAQLARNVDDFTLPDYDGNPVTLSELKGDSVMLLAFWFPT